ncbi:hypothetical protein HYH03_018857 [Edaphochlamys debaryana]|uniref:Uncharacterized protein n=1 Tax=Edaphochlamys debaryana TaxID=47281 RepID=A0A835XL08_9CHLO|nr:hypothetical protein HYH03_018857 [Edaphochlamys debaryana]|eukprot:KAG2482194.1 hypothetical protein HYH03_018857 [Edaphochlamys debaryana]
MLSSRIRLRTGPFAAPGGARTAGKPSPPGAAVQLVDLDETVAALGLGALATSLRSLTVRTSNRGNAATLRQRTALAWPLAALRALPGLKAFHLVGGYSRPSALLLQPGAPGPANHVAGLVVPVLGTGLQAEEGGRPQAWEGPEAEAGRPRSLRRLVLTDHLSFLPMPLPVADLDLDLAEGRLRLDADLNVGRLLDAAWALGALVRAALEGPAQGSRAGVSAVGFGGLRVLEVARLMVNRCPREGEWEVLEGFAGEGGGRLELRRLCVTYPEAGVAQPAWVAEELEPAGAVAGSGSVSRGTLGRALALAAGSCGKLELRLPPGDQGLVGAVARELGSVPEGLWPREVLLEWVGTHSTEGGDSAGGTGEGQRGDGEGGEGQESERKVGARTLEAALMGVPSSLRSRVRMSTR